MRLTVRKIDGRSVEIDTHDAVLLRDLRAMIGSDVIRCSPEAIRLIFSGRVLGNDDSILSTLGLFDGAVIHAIAGTRSNTIPNPSTPGAPTHTSNSGGGGAPGPGILFGVASMDDNGNIRLLSPPTTISTASIAQQSSRIPAGRAGSHDTALYPNSVSRFNNALEHGLATISQHTRDMNRQLDMSIVNAADPTSAMAAALENLAGALSTSVPSIVSMSSNLRHQRLNSPHSTERIASLRRIGDLRLALDRKSSASHHISTALGEFSFRDSQQVDESSPSNQRSSDAGGAAMQGPAQASPTPNPQVHHTTSPAQPRQIHIPNQGILSSAQIDQI